MVVYILYSERLKKYYTGNCADIAIRLEQHNSGLSSFTGKGIPWKLVWQKDVESRTHAILLERKIKKRGAQRFLVDQGLRAITPQA